jgi:hypothetical protein
MVNIDFAAMFADYSQQHSPADLQQAARRRGGNSKNVSRAIAHHRDRGAAILYDATSGVWFRSNDADQIRERNLQKLDWSAYRMMARELRAVRGEFESQARPPVALKRELIRQETACITIGAMIDMTATEVLADTAVVEIV